MKNLSPCSAEASGQSETKKLPLELQVQFDQLAHLELGECELEQLIKLSRVVADLYWSAAVEETTHQYQYQRRFTYEEVDTHSYQLLKGLGRYPASELAYDAARHVLSGRRSSLGGKVEASEQMLNLLPWFRKEQ